MEIVVLDILKVTLACISPYWNKSCVGILLYILQMQIGIEVCYKSSFLYDVSDNMKIENFTFSCT